MTTRRWEYSGALMTTRRWQCSDSSAWTQDAGGERPAAAGRGGLSALAGTDSPVVATHERG